MIYVGDIANAGGTYILHPHHQLWWGSLISFILYHTQSLSTSVHFYNDLAKQHNESFLSGVSHYATYLYLESLTAYIWVVTMIVFIFKLGFINSKGT